MDGYYDPVVLQVLDKPVAILGVWGSCIPDVAAHISSYTGIPFVDIERHMEHSYGASLSFLRGNPEKILELERQSLKQVLSVRPYPIIALRPETMWDERCSQLLRTSTTAYIQVDFLIAQERILEWCKKKNYTRLLNLQGIDPRSTLDFQDLVARSEKKYEDVDIVVQAKRHHPRHIAQDTVQILFG
ncbi:MAG: hypothetical protein CL916_04300 [Deltaproteobacteria bacterium]|nr:hypothetical protein [Deltaproteobacteria bacterium]